MTARPPAPHGLGGRGRKLWRSVVGGWDLSDAELLLLTEAARVADRLEELRALITAEGVAATGSQGQRIVHPALVEERQQRDLLARLLGRLALPDDEVEAAATAFGRKGAAARWRPTARKG